MTPEDWLAIVQNTVAEAPGGDQVIVSLESTMTGWRVSINPVRTLPPAGPPEGPAA